MSSDTSTARPAVCVVVPVYNAAATLDACVGSILSQEVEGGLCCVLVNDGSTDDSGARCDAFAARDPRVAVVHQADGGVSAARNAGLARARGKYLVFLDSDDALLPGALAAALAAQTADPGALVLWHYTKTRPGPDAAPAPLPPAAAQRPRAALARLYLDCLIGMPWNKLYRLDVASKLKFNTKYTLGEDLQFVLDYLDALTKASPAFHFAVVEPPLTFYDCSKTDGTLSTRYLPEFCRIWPEHFARLNAACAAAACPPEDMLPLHRAELTTLAEGAADILRRAPEPMGIRRDQAAAALRQPWVLALLKTMAAERNYSAYRLPVRWRNLSLLYTLARAKRENPALYGKLDWAGYYLLGGHMARD